MACLETTFPYKHPIVNFHTYKKQRKAKLQIKTNLWGFWLRVPWIYVLIWKGLAFKKIESSDLETLFISLYLQVFLNFSEWLLLMNIIPSYKIPRCVYLLMFQFSVYRSCMYFVTHIKYIIFVDDIEKTFLKISPLSNYLLLEYGNTVDSGYWLYNLVTLPNSLSNFSSFLVDNSIIHINIWFMKKQFYLFLFNFYFLFFFIVFAWL